MIFFHFFCFFTVGWRYLVESLSLLCLLLGYGPVMVMCLLRSRTFLCENIIVSIKINKNTENPLSALKAVLFVIMSYAYFSILRMVFLLICHVKSQKPVSKFAYIKKKLYLCTRWVHQMKPAQTLAKNVIVG